MYCATTCIVLQIPRVYLALWQTVDLSFQFFIYIFDAVVHVLRAWDENGLTENSMQIVIILEQLF